MSSPEQLRVQRTHWLNKYRRTKRLLRDVRKYNESLLNDLGELSEEHDKLVEENDRLRQEIDALNQPLTLRQLRNTGGDV